MNCDHMLSPLQRIRAVNIQSYKVSWCYRWTICSNFDSSILLNPKSGRHSNTVTEADEIRLFKELRKLRPFRFTPGRMCDGFQDIGHVPSKLEDFPKFNYRIHQIISRLTGGFNVAVEEEEEEDYENLDNLPPI